jgi:hypothetical protein
MVELEFGLKFPKRDTVPPSDNGSFLCPSTSPWSLLEDPKTPAWKSEFTGRQLQLPFQTHQVSKTVNTRGQHSQVSQPQSAFSQSTGLETDDPSNIRLKTFLAPTGQRTQNHALSTTLEETLESSTLCGSILTISDAS